MRKVQLGFVVVLGVAILLVGCKAAQENDIIQNFKAPPGKVKVWLADYLTQVFTAPKSKKTIQLTQLITTGSAKSTFTYYLAKPPFNKGRIWMKVLKNNEVNPNTYALTWRVMNAPMRFADVVVSREFTGEFKVAASTKMPANLYGLRIISASIKKVSL